MHSTNYFKTFIEIAEDCPAEAGEVPPMRGTKKSVANLQFEMVYDHPYKYTSDEVLFGVYAQRKGYTKNEMEEQRKLFFSKGQPCFRASPLTKRYGWGVHSDEQGRVAIYPVDSEEYQRFVQDEEVNKVKAMRSSRVKK
jgi:hypothetical protein